MTDDTDPVEKVRRALAAAEDVEMDGVPLQDQHRKDGGAKVTHIRSDPARLKPRANAILDNILRAGDVKPLLNRNYLVKGWLDTSSVSAHCCRSPTSQDAASAARLPAIRRACEIKWVMDSQIADKKVTPGSDY